MTVVQRLLLIVLFAAIPIGILQIISVRQEAAEQQDELAQTALRTAYRAGAEQKRIVEGARQLLSALSLVKAVRERDEKYCSMLAKQLQAQFPIYIVIGVADARGHIWCSSTRTGARIADRPYFQKAIRTREFTTGGFIVGRDRGWPSLNFSLPFADADGRLMGVLVAGLDLKRLAADVGRAQLPPHSELAIIGPDQKLLVHLPNGQGIGSQMPDRFGPAFRAERPGVMRVRWFDGSDRLLAFTPPAVDRGMPFLIAIGVDRAVAAKALRDETLVGFGMLLFVLGAALLLAWRFATHYIRRPVKRLAQTVAAWRDGDETARVGRLDPGSEFYDLGTAFDALAETVVERERRLRDTLESTTDIVATIGPDWSVTFLNGRAEARLGALNPLHKKLWKAFPEITNRELRASLRTAMEERRPTQVIFRYDKLAGHFEVNAFPATDGGLTLFIREVTAQHRAQEELRHLALNDPLTELPNRAHAMQVATEKVADRSLSALALIDLDGFKHVNDRLGHPAGDEMLRQVARRLSSCASMHCMIARLGGDEFVALLFGLDKEQCVAIGDSLIEALAREPFYVHGLDHRVTASCGIVFLDEATNAGAEGLLADADLALYGAKAAGGAISHVYTQAERYSYEARRQLEDELARAVAIGEFELYYQPQLRLADARLVGAEALLRWNHPDRGVLAPGEFMHVLAGSRHTLKVGGWIVDEACRQAALWLRRGLAIRVGINLFAEQLRWDGFDDYMHDILKKYELPTGAVEIEVTEDIGLESAGSREALSRLRATGVPLALDDFGTGFASLKSLKDLPVDRLKIDRGFVSQLPHNPHDRAIVEAILALGRTLGLEVIAEGVETDEQERYLVSRGCEEAQGYRYGRPMPARAFCEYLRRQLSDAAG
ncbi:EAL domain-containing protein [Sphingomonas sp. ID0503]|uniref:bifunctional diguanylate cyclase/phosphodiesterase n=1 Tax=Sphingomonas sp. ID0503 TaxID=3399691 RepID=UPI003AFB7B59